MPEKKPELKKAPEGKLYEKYVAQLFNMAGFKVTSNKRIKKEDIEHEIDVMANLPGLEKPIIIECKNVSHFKKGLIDAFIGKLSDLEGEYSSAGFVINLKRSDESTDEETLKQYRKYCKRKGITFFDEEDFEELTNTLSSLETNKEKQDSLLKAFNVGQVSTDATLVIAIILIVIGIITLPILIGIIPLAIGIIMLIKYSRKK